MDPGELFRAVFALLLTLGLIGLGAVAMRRLGPDALARLQAGRRERRLTLVETLVLDPARRLVLVRLDDEERLILLGEGRTLETLKPAARRRRAPGAGA
ncbi:MAG: flagellar biosynthetic protein FliO [Pseudomonadota bacterium]